MTVPIFVDASSKRVLSIFLYSLISEPTYSGNFISAYCCIPWAIFVIILPIEPIAAHAWAKSEFSPSSNQSLYLGSLYVSIIDLPRIVITDSIFLAAFEKSISFILWIFFGTNLLSLSNPYSVYVKLAYSLTPVAILVIKSANFKLDSITLLNLLSLLNHPSSLNQSE